MRQFMVAVLVGLAGCGVGELSCTDIAVVSVAAEVTDLDGNAIMDVQVTYTVDGGDPETADCIGDGADCTEFWTAFETEGEFEITAFFQHDDPNDPDCVFSDSASTIVTVTGDECHVETQEVLLELDATLRTCLAQAD